MLWCLYWWKSWVKKSSGPETAPACKKNPRVLGYKSNQDRFKYDTSHAAHSLSTLPTYAAENSRYHRHCTGKHITPYTYSGLHYFTAVMSQWLETH